MTFGKDIGATGPDSVAITGRASVLVAVPLYRAPELVEDLFEALRAVGDELAAIGGVVLLLNDSPDDARLRAALDRHLPALRRSASVELIDNPRNLGFVATANIALATGRARGVDVVLLNSDALPTPGALSELVTVAYGDPLIGFVSPRSDNATICSSPAPARFRGLARAEALAAHRAVERYLPRVTYAPTAVGFCLYVKSVILEEFGLLDPVYGRGYNEENDLVMRANLRGYHAVIANRAFVHHIGTVSFGQSSTSKTDLEETNHRILLDRYPHYDTAVSRYLEGRHYRAEHLLAGLVPDDEGRLRLLFDARDLAAMHNGTTELARALIGAFAARFGTEFRVGVACREDIAVFHGLDRVAGLEVLDPSTLHDGGFAVAIKLAQPFRLAELAELGMLAPVAGYLFLDTITLDCQQLDGGDYRTIWDWMAETSAFLGFISQFGADQFERRFPHDRRAVRFVARCSTDVRDYEPQSRASRDDHVLVVGNHYPHKHVAETVAAIRGLTDRPLAVLGGGAESPLPGVIDYVAGDLPQGVVDGLYDRASLVVFPSHYEGFGLPVMHALARGRPVIARDLEPLREIKALCPEAVNLHLFPTTAALAAAVARGVAWHPADRTRRARSWWDTAGDLRDGIRTALDRLGYGDLYARLLKLQACARQGVPTIIAKPAPPRPPETIAPRAEAAAWALAACSEAGMVIQCTHEIDEAAEDDEIVADLFDRLEDVAPEERVRVSAPRSFGDARLRRLMLAAGATPAPMAGAAPDRLDYLVRPFVQWRSIGNSAADDTQFVLGLYRSMLGRAGDPGGVETYVGELARGRTRSYLLRLFVASAERLALVSAVHALPDPDDDLAGQSR